MNELAGAAYAREVVRRTTVQPDAFRAKRTWRFTQDLHEFQQRLRSDPSKLLVADPGRRGGKSTVAAAMLLEAAGNSPAGSYCVYIALTRKSAKRIMWKELHGFNRKYSLGIVFNSTELVATLRNGAQILLAAANDEAAIERLRGSAYVLVVIDEAGSFGEHLRILIRDVLEPSLIDHDGRILMIGTPNATCTGLFYEAATQARDQKTGRILEPGWSHHHWTVLDNPYVPNARAWLKDYRERRGVSEDDPIYRREWGGEWIPSAESLVFKFTRGKNTFREIPKGNYDWQYGVSIDLGYDDPTAIGVFQWCDELPDLYVPWLLRKSGLVPSTIAAVLKAIQKKHDLAWVVVDQGGGAGKIVTEEFVQRYGIAAEGAEKQKKVTYIGFLNGDMQAGRVKLREASPGVADWRVTSSLSLSSCEPLMDELNTIQWDPDKPGKEDQRFKNDIADMLIYGYRKAYHYLFDTDKKPEELVADPGSREALDEEEREMEEEAEEAARKAEREWWEP